MNISNWRLSKKCSAPMKIELIGVSHEDAVVQWIPSDDEPQTYEVYCIETEMVIDEYEKWMPRGEDEEQLYLAATVSGTSTISLISELKECCQYLVVLFAIDSNGDKVRCALPEYKIFKTSSPTTHPNFSYQLKQNALVAATSVLSPSSALHCNSVTVSHCIATATILNRNCTKASTTDNTILYAFKEQSSQSSTTDNADLIRSLQRDSQTGQNPTICFTGYEMGGLTALRAMLSVISDVSGNIRDNIVCVVFGTPIVLSVSESIFSQNIALKDRVLQMVHSSDPIAVSGICTDGAAWLETLKDHLKVCDQLSPSLIFSAPMHKLYSSPDHCLGYEKTFVEKHFVSLSSSNRLPDNHAFGKIEFLGNKNFPNHNFNLSSHSPAMYANHIVLNEPHLKGQHKGLFPGLHRVQIKPMAARTACSLLITDLSVELKIFGKNLSVVHNVVLYVFNEDTDEVRHVDLNILTAEDHKLTATQQIGKSGYLETNSKVSVLLESQFGSLKINDICCDNASDQLPEWASRYSDMSISKLVSIASQLTILKVRKSTDDSFTVTNTLRRLLKSLLAVSKFTELHNKEAIGRNLILKTRTSILSEVHEDPAEEGEDNQHGSSYEIFQKAFDEEDSNTMASIVSVSVEPFCSHHIRLSLVENRGTGTSIAVLTGKTLALVGGAAALLNPLVAVAAGELAIAAATATHLTDYFLNLCDLPKTYEAKLSSILETLGIKTDCIPDKIYFHEALICGRINELLGSDNPLLKNKGDDQEIREGFVKQVVDQWKNLCIDPEGGGWLIAHCVEADRSTFARLLYTIVRIHEIRKLLSKTFVVQLVGSTNAGKSTIASSVFDLPAVAGSMANGITKHQYGYQTSYNQNLIIVDNPGMNDVTAIDHTPVILDYASCYLIAQDWGSGLRNLHFAVCLAEIQATGIPFRLLVTKSDQMVMSENWKKLRVLRWRDEQLPLLNDFLSACREFLSGTSETSDGEPTEKDNTNPGSDILLSNDAIKSLNELKSRWGTSAVQKIGAPISSSDCILCGLNVLPDKQFHTRRRAACRTAGIQMVPELQDSLATMWGAVGFEVTFPITNKQDLCEGESDDEE